MKAFTSAVLRVLETVHAVPRGAFAIQEVLNVAADRLVAAGRLGIFTPMYFHQARKPGRLKDPPPWSACADHGGRATVPFEPDTHRRFPGRPPTSRSSSYLCKPRPKSIYRRTDSFLCSDHLGKSSCMSIIRAP